MSLDRLQVDEQADVIAYAARSRPGLQAHIAAAPIDLGPEDVAAVSESFTGAYLAPLLGVPRANAS